MAEGAALVGEPVLRADVHAQRGEARAVARGEARGEPVQVAAALVGIFLQTATFVLYGRLPGPLSRYAEPVAAAAMRILR